MSYQKYNPKQSYSPKQSVILTPPDRTVLIVVAFLVIIGIISIFSASAPKCMELGQNPARYALFQMLFLVFQYLQLVLIIQSFKSPILYTVLFSKNWFSSFVILPCNSSSKSLMDKSLGSI